MTRITGKHGTGWIKECTEWAGIRDEMAISGKAPTPFEVSLEQRKRMAIRGEHPMTYEEIIAEERARDEAQHADTIPPPAPVARRGR